jgi:hypothetical protein
LRFAHLVERQPNFRPDSNSVVSEYLLEFLAQLRGQLADQALPKRPITIPSRKTRFG